ncbi:MAG TPA: hypothetical protein DCQ06_10820 [Myxococcales bacterium]|mgnify:CR=1 FL=1|nr:hypothetical protein [Myxococcales bacterium]HAN32079.1 hypothetical protein [Myxococcales bacterium]
MVSQDQQSELRGSQLLRRRESDWPLVALVGQRQQFSEGWLPLDSQLADRRDFTLFEAHPFEFDRLSDLIESHTQGHETYAADFKVKSDHDIPSEVLDACQHNHYPQFILRNIGRMEKTDCDPEDPLPMQRQPGVAASAADDLLDEVRRAKIPKPEMAQIWTQRFVHRVRTSLRRLLQEDPWGLRFGAEAKANYDGPVYQYIVEGTHPDDLPDSWWGPETSLGPEHRVAPRGKKTGEQAVNIYDAIRAIQQETSDR